MDVCMWLVQGDGYIDARIKTQDDRYKYVCALRKKREREKKNNILMTEICRAVY